MEKRLNKGKSLLENEFLILGFLNDQSCSLAYFLKKHNGKCEVGVAGST